MCMVWFAYSIHYLMEKSWSNSLLIDQFGNRVNIPIIVLWLPVYVLVLSVNYVSNYINYRSNASPKCCILFSNPEHASPWYIDGCIVCDIGIMNPNIARPETEYNRGFG